MGMEDRAYKNAMARKRELLADIEEIDKFLELWRRYAGTEPEQDTPESPPSVGDSGEAVQSHLRALPRDEERANVIRTSILKRGRPLARGEIAEGLEEDGYKVTGADPSKNIGTIMWRLRDHFTNIEGYGYWPSDVPYRQAGFEGHKATADQSDASPLEKGNEQDGSSPS
tara:strand:- start:848 stop:1357 length:510 start_codon:yes stop_codon:yes gene_type:complete